MNKGGIMIVPGKWITIGKKGFSVDNIEKLLQYDVSGIRINTGHSTYEWIKSIVMKLAALSFPLDRVYLDIANTKPRIHIPEHGEIVIAQDECITIHKGDQNSNIYILPNHVCYFESLSKDEILYFGDGQIECTICDNTDSFITLRAKENATFSNNMAIGIVGKSISHFLITENEKKEINEILSQYPISLILSFVNSAEDVIYAKKLFPRAARVVPKIETENAVQNFCEIAKECDTVFVGRGDLALSTGIEKIGVIQQELVQKAHAVGCRIAIGTGILDSLKTQEIPSRAEIIDITNCCFQRVDYIVLTSETGGSKTPYKAIYYLDKTLEFLGEYHKHE